MKNDLTKFEVGEMVWYKDNPVFHIFSKEPGPVIASFVIARKRFANVDKEWWYGVDCMEFNEDTLYRTEDEAIHGPVNRRL